MAQRDVALARRRRACLLAAAAAGLVALSTLRCLASARPCGTVPTAANPNTPAEIPGTSNVMPASSTSPLVCTSTNTSPDVADTRAGRGARVSASYEQGTMMCLVWFSEVMLFKRPEVSNPNPTEIQFSGSEVSLVASRILTRKFNAKRSRCCLVRRFL